MLIQVQRTETRRMGEGKITVRCTLKSIHSQISTNVLVRCT
jgi:hypothetical protein